MSGACLGYDVAMASAALHGKRIAILVADGFEQVEMTQPREALESAGARTALVSPAGSKVRAAKHEQPGDEFTVDVELAQARPDDYDALVLPGGVRNPDTLRTIPEAVAFVRAFVDARKPIAAICHGPWTLVEADAVRGKTLTSWPSLKTDIRNAGGHWEDREVVRDGLLVTSRKPDDIPAFNRETIELFSRETANAR